MKNTAKNTKRRAAASPRATNKPAKPTKPTPPPPATAIAPGPRCAVVKLSVCKARGSLLARDYLGPDAEDLATLRRAERAASDAKARADRLRRSIADAEAKLAADIAAGLVRPL